MTDRLDANVIRRSINSAPCRHLNNLEVFEEIDSTNSYLMQQSSPSPGNFRIVMAEHQTGGRGQRGRRWWSQPGSGLCLSMSYSFSESNSPELLPNLTLAVGVGIASALQGTGVRGVQLKWPNDLVTEAGKLGGILTEARVAKASCLTLVVGVGLNVDLQRHSSASKVTDLAPSATDIASHCEQTPTHNALAGLLIDALFRSLVEFETNGFASFRDSWRRLDSLFGHPVCVELDDREIRGVCRGVASDGALLVEVDGKETRILSGSVTKGQDMASRHR